MRAVVLMRDAARSIAASRFFGSVSVGLCTRARHPSSTATCVVRLARRLAAFCLLVAIGSCYRGGRRLFGAGLVTLRVLCPPRSVEHADEARAGAAAALFAHDLGVDAQGELGVGVSHLVHDVDGVLAAQV